MYRAKKMLKHWNVQIQKGSNSENPAFVMNVKAHPVLGQSRMCTSREAISYIPSATQTPPTAQLRAIVECPTDEGDGDQPGAETDTETDGMRPETLAAPNPTSTSVSKLPSSGNLKPACPRDTILSTTQILEVIQRAIQLHENNELTKAFHLYCLTALQGSSMGLFLSGLALRHGWGCVVDQELALACFEYAVHNSIKTIHLFESSRRSSTCRPGGVDIEAILDRHRRTSKNASVDATLPRMVKGIMQQEATLGVKTTQERTNGSNAFLSVDGNQAQAASQSTLAQMARFELAMSVYELGQCYFHGWGVTKSKSTAAFYYRLGADLGDLDAQADLAQCYMNGTGVKPNRFLAASYFRLSALQGRNDFGNSWIYKEKYSKYFDENFPEFAAMELTNKQGKVKKDSTTGDRTAIEVLMGIQTYLNEKTS